MADKSPYLLAFGANLRRIREERGLTQIDLAVKLGLHHNYVGALERAERNPTIGSLEKIAIGLGTDLLTLLDPNGQGNDPSH